ncbi:ATP-dependent zinc protease family protein [Shewanella glacialimarina]|uniref:ATP-dependent zinc protease family protein n=1 Tax=Shewanella glacialimarina TaxID=2590884 RepID=UPI001CF86507|nr:ATP-dependent zinc protease [Shewanella glacialimarina]UCX04816.1 ATP-dependent zinc protease [Shewanella glacialimarina]
MFKQALALTIAVLIVSGCTATQHSHAPSISNADLNSTLQTSQAQIITAFNDQCSKQSDDITGLSIELRKLKTQVSEAMAQSQKLAVVPVVAPAPRPVAVPSQCPESLIGEKFLLGEAESVYMDEVKTTFATRIDTGAESSSLDARNIVLFERNGEEWVRYDVMTNGPDKAGNTFESKVERFVRIKQDATSEDDRRPVIHAHLKIGQYSAETDLNLTDRSHLDYPLLLGRKFMKDIAIVDVGQIYIHGKDKNQVTTLIK